MGPSASVEGMGEWSTIQWFFQIQWRRSVTHMDQNGLQPRYSFPSLAVLTGRR